MAGPEFIRAAALAPVIKVGNTNFNTEEIIRLAKEADRQGAGILVFPRLSITGNTCGTLLYSEHLYRKQLEGFENICRETINIKAVIVLGMMLRTGNRYLPCAAVLQNGRVKGLVPETEIENALQAENFSTDLQTVSMFGEAIPLGNLLFRDPDNGLTLAVGTAGRLNDPLSSEAHILCTPSADAQIVGETTFRRYRVLMKSRENNCGILYASAGPGESTTDVVYSGHCLIAECGSLISEGPVLSWNGTAIYGDLDFGKIRHHKSSDTRLQGTSAGKIHRGAGNSRTVSLQPLPLIRDMSSLRRTYSKTPFVPDWPEKARESCEETFEIQATALAKRVSHTHAKRLVLGISGGLDSTLALLVAVRALEILSRNPSDILAITMPGFGTTGKTYQNALTLMKLLGTEIREIPISESVLLHFRDIGHEKEIHNAVYENSQARERTQILMDIANKEGGLHVGTGDLSEVALGWSTYNGDHMAMYNVNGGVPKTLIQAILGWFIDYRLGGKPFSADDRQLAETLGEILSTPISPELFPPDKDGNIIQKTEETVGPYRLHDFFLYHMVRNGTPPKTLLAIAAKTFEDEFDEPFIRKWLKEFYKRFFSQQFKRNCSPDGPKVGWVVLSPRGGWAMPSDMDGEVWISEL